MNHREHLHGLEIAYYRDNHACDKAEAQRCVVASTAGHGWFPPFVFELPADERNLYSLLLLAKSTWTAGDTAARAEIRKVLGIKE